MLAVAEAFVALAAVCDDFCVGSLKFPAKLTAIVDVDQERRIRTIGYEYPL